MNLRSLSIFANDRLDRQTVLSRSAEEFEFLIRISDNLNNIVAWVKSNNYPSYLFQTDYFFSTTPLDIDASPETVWELVIDVNQYYKLSNGAITADINSELGTIGLQLYKDETVGKFIQKINATVSIVGKVDKDNLIVGWGLKLPQILGGGRTERYQVLERLPENKTRSYIVDKIPGVIGFFTNLTMDKLIKGAFKNLNEGFKKEAELIETRKTVKYKNY